MDSKFSNILTILLVIVIIAIIGIVGFLGYKYIKNESSKNNAEDFVDSFNEQNSNNKNNKPTGDATFEGVQENKDNQTEGKPQYKGYDMVGTIEIPATKVKYPVLDHSTLSKTSLETSVVEIYGPGLNQVGNTTIAGHNFRNGTFFSNNKKLNVGDKIYITDLSGKKQSYTIYNKYETDENDSDYMVRDTQGAVEVSLTTCTDDSKARLIIWAKAD
ncbi:MAG: sortase [Clostridia bacterium]|nr:sortase [Clostridia bacterium]